MCSTPGKCRLYRSRHARMKPIRAIHQAKESAMSELTKSDPRLSDVLKKDGQPCDWAHRSNEQGGVRCQSR